ncbi:MAG: peptide-methionine (R)-S-oxide reductase MsrB [Methanolinea sp.]|jgi:peptide-methionine (R)-S-oxide reductase|nr:peptide-methionine (R)-S-oxide reductase MsrB [Methanolinea sp.]
MLSEDTCDNVIIVYDAATGTRVPKSRICRSSDEWRALLAPEVYDVTRGRGTEPPFSSPLYRCTGEGIYRCACCGTDLFLSGMKFDSGTGWPSFRTPVDSCNVHMEKDTSLGWERIEVLCARCGAHLGHVFPDGPPPEGTRYCINGLALSFHPAGRK